MVSMRKIFVMAVAAVFLGLSSFASAQQIIYVVCQSYKASKNCYKCSNYFSVRSEDQAQKRCRGATPNYFPSVGALQAWMLANCTCDDD